MPISETHRLPRGALFWHYRTCSVCHAKSKRQVRLEQGQRCTPGQD
jgi:hypothetical protein